MNRLTEKMTALKNRSEKGLIVYITAGAPDFAATLKAVSAAEKSGADVIELGIPFSDPIADGTVIQNASVAAIKNGCTPEKVVECVRQLREVTDIPLLGMGYVNMLMYFGAEKYMEDFKQAGLDGFIIPDLPYEEAAEIKTICRQQDMHLIDFITQNSSPERLKKICAEAEGFVYCVSNNGVTGVKEIDYTPISQTIKQAAAYTQTPMAVGFGIGSPEAAKRAAQAADAVIVGSAVVQKVMDGDIKGLDGLVSSIKKALRSV